MHRFRPRAAVITLRGLAPLCAAALVLSGCLSTRYVTNTPRSATEQLLLARAVEKAVAKLEWPPVAGHAVAVETASFNDKDAPYVKAAIEAHARALGARVVPPDHADMVLVVLAGSIGTVSRTATFGIPELPTPFGVTTPEIPFVKALKQHGYAELRLASADHAGAQAAPESPSTLGRSYFDVYTFFLLAVHHDDIYPGERLNVGPD